MIASGTLREINSDFVVGDDFEIPEFAHINDAGGVKIGSDCIVGKYFCV